jgi:hypothetical protein
MAERERWSLWLPVGIGAGVAAYFALDTEPPYWLGPLRQLPLVPHASPCGSGPGRLWLAWPCLRSQPASLVRVLAIVSPPAAPPAPGAYDFRRNAFFQKIGGYGFAVGRLR